MAVDVLAIILPEYDPRPMKSDPMKARENLKENEMLVPIPVDEDLLKEYASSGVKAK